MATYYVDDVNGSDANAGTSEGAGNAWLTIQKAADTAVAGDIVYIKGTGTYNEQVDFDTNSGTVTAPITFVGYTTTIADNGKITWDGAAHCILSLGVANHIRFRNIIFTGCTSYCLSYTIAGVSKWRFHNCNFTASTTLLGLPDYNGPNYLYFSKCIISNMSGAGYSARVTGITFQNCKIIDNGSHGLFNDGYNGGIYIINNLIAGNNGQGIVIDTDTSNVAILNNTIQGNTGNGININGGANNANVIIYGNIIANHNGAGDVGLNVATLTGTTFLVCNRNFFYDNTTHTSGTHSSGLDDVTLTGDPFVAHASDNWMLNNTAGAGAAVRAANGIDYDGTNIGYNDGGAMQHQDAGGGGAVYHGAMNGGLI